MQRACAIAKGPDGTRPIRARPTFVGCRTQPPIFCLRCRLKRHGLMWCTSRIGTLPPHSRPERRSSAGVVQRPAGASRSSCCGEEHAFLPIRPVRSAKRSSRIPDRRRSQLCPEMEVDSLLGLIGWRNMPTQLRDRISAARTSPAVADGYKATFKGKESEGGQPAHGVAGTPEDLAARR